MLFLEWYGLRVRMDRSTSSIGAGADTWVFALKKLVHGDGRHEETLMADRPLVSIVDDDESVRESLPDLLREFGFAVHAFSSAEEFLASDGVDQTSCLILDVAMPGMSGPDLQRELTRRGKQIPIVFITAHGDETLGPRLVQQGAVACLFKPFVDTALLDAVSAALRVSRSNPPPGNIE
jgi:FixJ family two-component response regulator